MTNGSKRNNVETLLRQTLDRSGFRFHATFIRYIKMAFCNILVRLLSIIGSWYWLVVLYVTSRMTIWCAWSYFYNMAALHNGQSTRTIPPMKGDMTSSHSTGNGQYKSITWLTMAMYNWSVCMRECNGTGISPCDVYIDAFIINELLAKDEILFISHKFVELIYFAKNIYIKRIIFYIYWYKEFWL